MNRLARRREEDGSVLIVTLIFMAIFGLLTPLMLGQAEANLENTSLVRELDNKVYAADAGVEYAIQRIRSDSTACAGTAADPFAVQTLPTQVVNSHNVEVRCQRIEGFSLGALGWAVITTQPPNRRPPSLSTLSGTGYKFIDGSVYASGICSVGGDATCSNQLRLTVKNGDVYERQDAKTCTTQADKPASPALTVSPSPPYHYFCTNLAPPSPPNALPDSVPGKPEKAPALAPGTTDCTVFYPGTYKPGDPGTVFVSADKKRWRLDMTRRNYFVSGTYYLEDVSLVTVPNNTDVWAGRKHSIETAIPGNTPCASPSDDNGSRGTGAKVILGGSADVRSPGVLEIFARCPPLPPGAAGEDPCNPFVPSSEGARGISITTVPPTGAPAGWKGSTVIAKDNEKIEDRVPVVDGGDGNNVVFVVHGMVHVAGHVAAFATNNAIATFQGGIVAYSLLLQSSTSGTDGLAVSVRHGPGSRRIVITSTAKGKPGKKDVTATAVVRVQNTTSRPVTIESWRST